ncbi:MAG TPA: hypothetical protein VER11_29795 [Polyangiaceae bacterium]|nr:hypothetical protein [Polyangiaceae bacterium]
MKALQQLPKDVQRAAMAVTHLEDATLATVLKAVDLARRDEHWPKGRNYGPDAYLLDIRRFVREIRIAERPPAKVVSLEAYRASKAGQ